MALGGVCVDGNILNNGTESLKELKDKLIKQDRFQNDNSVLTNDVKKLDKAIKSKEKALENELKLTIKKRREEIEATYNQEISNVKDEVSKVSDKKEKSKNAQKSERINIETADLLEENKQIKQEIKTILKEDKIPSYVNSKLFFALYMPKSVKEYGIILAFLILILVLIPSGIYFLILPEQKATYLIIIYVVTVLIFGGAYIIIGNKVKYKHLQALQEIQVKQINISKNEAKQKKIKKNIKRDEDESLYILDHYDEKINELTEEIERIKKRKQEALTLFESETRPIITDEISGRHSDELLKMNAELMDINQKIKNNNDNIKHLSRDLVENYEVYLGKEFMSVQKIDQLIKIIEEKEAEDISSAIIIYKKQT